MAAGDTHAVAGIARAGETWSGYVGGSIDFFDATLDVRVAGTSRLVPLNWESLSVTMGINDEPSTMTGVFSPRGGFTISRGESIEVWLGGYQTGIPLFGGTILQVQHSIRRASNQLDYVVQATDYRWLMDRFARVSGTFANQGINTILNKIISDFTDPASNFVAGYCPESNGTISSITFDNVTVSQAVSRLASAVDGGGLWTVNVEQGGDKRVSIYDEPDDEANTIQLTSAEQWRDMEITYDLSQAKNRVTVIGAQTQTTSPLGSLSTVIPVEETKWFASGGGSVRADGATIAYTGRSTESGPGSLTGVTLTTDISQGSVVRPVVTVNDTAAQTALATALGGGQSGIALHEESDTNLDDAECALRAASRLDELSTPNIDMSYSLAPLRTGAASTWPSEEDIHGLRPGRPLTVNITAPLTINDTFRIRSVTLTPRSRGDTGELVWDRRVTAQLVLQRSNESLGLLKRALGG